MEPLLLLTALFLGLWTGTGTADRPERVIVMEDQDALLLCSLDGSSQNFDWKKETSGVSKSVFMSSRRMHYQDGGGGQDAQFQDRVSFFEDQLPAGNASIVIRKTSPADSGNYTCNLATFPPKRLAQVELVVVHILKPRDIPGAAQKPYTSLERTTDGFLLNCSVEGAFPLPTVEWWDSAGNILPAEKPEVTQKNGRYNVFLQAKVTKSGYYRCVATQLEIHGRVTTKTFVPNSAVKPSITNLKESTVEALLQCEVLGVSPRTSLVIKDDAGNEFPVKDREEGGGGGEEGGGGGSDIIINVTVTADGFYHCVATQEGGQPHISQKIHVVLPESSTGWIVAALVSGALLLGIVLLVFLFSSGYRCKKPESSPPPGVL